MNQTPEEITRGIMERDRVRRIRIGSLQEHADSIVTYLTCGLCAREIDEIDESPKEYARIQVGLTETGLQVWCNRHEINIVELDFQGLAIAEVGENGNVLVEDFHSQMFGQCACCDGDAK